MSPTYFAVRMLRLDEQLEAARIGRRLAEHGKRCSAKSRCCSGRCTASAGLTPRGDPGRPPAHRGFGTLAKSILRPGWGP